MSAATGPRSPYQAVVDQRVTDAATKLALTLDWDHVDQWRRHDDDVHEAAVFRLGGLVAVVEQAVEAYAAGDDAGLRRALTLGLTIRAADR